MRASATPGRALRALAAVVLCAVLLPGVTASTPVGGATRAGRDVIVHLFGWPWESVAAECTSRLGTAGFGAVQVSPPQEHVVLPGYPWWQDYQPVSYRLVSRRGDRTAFAAMVRACHAAGVAVYADAVLNHMTAQPSGVGSGGTRFSRYEYPGLYGPGDFHHCDQVRVGGPIGHDGIADWNSRFEVQNCALLGLADLATETEPVRDRIAAYLNDLLALGVDGFRIDAAKHIPADDLAAIAARLDRPAYLYQEVLYQAGEPVRPSEYAPLGALIEARYGPRLSYVLRSGSLLLLEDLGEPLGVPTADFAPSANAVVYVDSHDSQRDGSTLTYADGPLYRLAQVFLLAWPYGRPMLMSSFHLSGFDDGPPADASGRTLPVRCGPGAFVCEHRAMAGMVGFRNAVGTAAPVRHWWATDDQLGFARGDRGYVMLNRAPQPVTRTVFTGLPAGTYTDVLHGTEVTVDDEGRATLTVAGLDAVAIYR